MDRRDSEKQAAYGDALRKVVPGIQSIALEVRLVVLKGLSDSAADSFLEVTWTEACVTQIRFRGFDSVNIPAQQSKRVEDSLTAVRVRGRWSTTTETAA